MLVANETPVIMPKGRDNIQSTTLSRFTEHDALKFFTAAFILNRDAKSGTSSLNSIWDSSRISSKSTFPSIPASNKRR